MKTRCVYCVKSFDQEQGLTCPYCHKDNTLTGLKEDQIHALHQTCHNQIRKYTDMKNNALTYLVIGTILLIIGGIFLFLSFRYNVRKVRVFTPGSTEFVVSVISLAISAFAIVFGTIRLIYSQSRIKGSQKTILATELKK